MLALGGHFVERLEPIKQEVGGGSIAEVHRADGIVKAIFTQGREVKVIPGVDERRRNAFDGIEEETFTQFKQVGIIRPQDVHIKQVRCSPGGDHIIAVGHHLNKAACLHSIQCGQLVERIRRRTQSFLNGFVG